MKIHLYRSFALAIIALSLFLTGCSSGAPDDVIKEAIAKNHNTIQYKLYFMDDYKITNSYTREMNGETYYVYEYDVNVHACDGCVGKIPQLKKTDTLQGSVSLVQRGDKWYF